MRLHNHFDLIVINYENGYLRKLRWQQEHKKMGFDAASSGLKSLQSHDV